MAKHIVGEWWPEAKRAEVVASYLVLGNATMVEAVTGVPSGTIRQWRTQPWWAELVDQIQQESDTELDSKLRSRVEKVLDLVDDRITNGDFQFNPHTGKFLRKPISLRDGWRAGKEMIDVRMMLRNQKPQAANQQAVADILKGLATEFASMALKQLNKDVIEAEVVDVPELQEGVRELSGETGSDSQTGTTECSPETSNEDGSGSQGGRDGCGPQEGAGQGGLEQPIQPESPVQEGQPVV